LPEVLLVLTQDPRLTPCLTLAKVKLMFQMVQIRTK